MMYAAISVKHDRTRSKDEEAFAIGILEKTRNQVDTRA
jgi:hypothetical protein